jgi:multiple sugar transport system ATP-binding protein
LGVNTTILSVRNISKQYQTAQNSGISDISFNIAEGEIVAIIGESGSGKSTLLKSIYGLLTLDSGEVRFQDKRVLGPDEQLIPGHKGMKMVTQDFSLNIYAKVYDNIASMLSNTDVKSKHEKTVEMMEHLHIAQLSGKRITELSGGEQQRVAIAKALVSDTRMLLLDEPFSQVDALLKNQLRADLKRIATETGVTVVLVSHDPADGLFLADKLLLMKDGQLLQQGQPRALYDNPQHLYTARLIGNANVLSATDALKLGIDTEGKNLVFYPEWVEIGSGVLQFTIKDVYYKGFYEELLLEANGVQLRGIQLSVGIAHKKNDQVLLNIDRYITLE